MSLSSSTISALAAAAAQRQHQHQRVVRPGAAGLVMGVMNHRSIAWSAAVALLNKGYNIIMTCQNERMIDSLHLLAQQWRQQRLNNNHHLTPNIHCVTCDVTSDSNLQRLFQFDLPQFLQDCDVIQQKNVTTSTSSDNTSVHTTSETTTTTLDTLVHSIAYAPPRAMKDGTLLTTTREDFALTMDISAYSLIATSRLALPFLSQQQQHQQQRHPSIVALTYLGSTRAIPNYNVMGPTKAALESIIRGLSVELGPPPHSIRVNAVSSGPLVTLAAKGGIRDFSNIRQQYETYSPLRRNVTVEEVGQMVASLASGEGGMTGMTGQTIFVDGGYNIVL